MPIKPMPIEACFFVCLYNIMSSKHEAYGILLPFTTKLCLTLSQQFPNLHLELTTTDTADGNTASISTATGALIGIILAVVLFTVINACALYTICIPVYKVYLRRKKTQGNSSSWWPSASGKPFLISTKIYGSHLLHQL